MEADFDWFVGIDWATEMHQVCVIGADGRIQHERQVAHRGEGLREFQNWLAGLANQKPNRVAIAIEVPRGVVVESLVERGFAVFAVNPKQLDRFRDRHTVAGAKDDRLDAFVLADSVRTDRQCFHAVCIDNPVVIQIRSSARLEAELTEELLRLANRFREQLHRYYVQLLQLCPSGNAPWLWALFELAPTPEKGAKLRKQRVERLLTNLRVRRVDVNAVIAALHEPSLPVSPGTAEAAADHAHVLVARLRMVRAQRSDCRHRLDTLLTQLSSATYSEGPGKISDVEILKSFPGIGRTVTAVMLAEASEPLAKRDYRVLRAMGGLAPVTRRSGKSHRVLERQGCNRRLRNALFHWARIAVQKDDRAKKHYVALRHRGHTHGRSLRQVGDRLLAILMSALRGGTLYDPTRQSRVLRGSPSQLEAVT